MIVCKTLFPTPTNEAVIAEQTEAHKNCENVKIHPEITRVMKTGKNPSSEKKLRINANFSFKHFSVKSKTYQKMNWILQF